LFCKNKDSFCYDYIDEENLYLLSEDVKRYIARQIIKTMDYSITAVKKEFTLTDMPYMKHDYYFGRGAQYSAIQAINTPLKETGELIPENADFILGLYWGDKNNPAHVGMAELGMIGYILANKTKIYINSKCRTAMIITDGTIDDAVWESIGEFNKTHMNEKYPMRYRFIDGENFFILLKSLSLNDYNTLKKAMKKNA